MDERDGFTDQNINITIPVKVAYQALDKYLGEKLGGEIISNENKAGKKSH